MSQERKRLMATCQYNNYKGDATADARNDFLLNNPFYQAKKNEQIIGWKIGKQADNMEVSIKVITVEDQFIKQNSLSKDAVLKVNEIKQDVSTFFEKLARLDILLLDNRFEDSINEEFVFEYDDGKTA